MWLWLHLNCRKLLQSRRGRGGGSVSMYSYTYEWNLPKKLSPKIFLLFPQETGEEGWSRVSGASRRHAHRHTHTQSILSLELENRFNYSLTNQIMSAFYFFVSLLACSRCRELLPFYSTERTPA